jgi:Nucleolar protein,Nop52.
LFNIIEKSSYKGSGLLFHIADVYIDEIPNITLKNKLSLINPFIELMKTSKLNQIVDMVYTRILLKLAENRENGLSD